MIINITYLVDSYLDGSYLGDSVLEADDDAYS
jgi:hypothetical protein